MNDDQIEKLKAFYTNYIDANLEELPSIYDDKVLFVDPLHEVRGCDALIAYFDNGRKGLLECRFFFKSQLSSGSQVALEWQMDFSHTRLNKKKILVNGCSLLSLCPQTGLVLSHTDYFDAGAMLYEHIPVLGGIVRHVKSKAAGAQ